MTLAYFMLAASIFGLGVIAGLTIAAHVTRGRLLRQDRRYFQHHTENKYD